MSTTQPKVTEPELMTLGAQLHALRGARGWTLEELAERSGLSKAFLSRLEGGSRQPSLAAVLTLARVFGVPVGNFFPSPAQDEGCAIVRGTDAVSRNADGISYFPLSSAGQFVNLQPIKITVSPTRQGDERYQHEGEEWFYVLKGKLRLLLGEKFYDLDAGDAAHFDSRLPHRLVALDGAEAQIILVACPIPITLNSRREMTAVTAGLG